MSTPTISRIQDVTLAIKAKVLGTSSPQNKSTVTAPTSLGGSDWTVTLTRQDDILTVSVLWKYTQQPQSHTCTYNGSVGSGFGAVGGNHHCNAVGTQRCTEGYCAMHLVPRKTPSNVATVSVTDNSLQTANSVKATIDIDKVLDDDEYCFDIIISTSMNLSRKAVEPPKPRHQDTMSDLLKDINSVDTCFVFDTEKTTSNVGLWAHSVILSKYERFSQMILEAASPASSSKDGSSAVADALDDTHLSTADDTFSKSSFSTTSPSTTVASQGPAIQTVLIEKFSLATFCVLLRYIYTGDVSLSVDTSQHAISMTESSLVLQAITRGGKKQESIRWNPLDSTSPWRFKDTAWEELLEAADYFGVSDLRAQCEEAVVKALDESKAVAMLFNTGPCFDKTKESAMQFVVKNMASMVKDGKEPFTLYKDHPDCYRVMFEVMRQRAVKDMDLR
ncbi:hypothetical protein BGZ58_010592 [Dissophora ornata]|nr:hypothetical protein BGZ58_010592 [Dissophora ornata]